MMLVMHRPSLGPTCTTDTTSLFRSTSKLNVRRLNESKHCFFHVDVLKVVNMMISSHVIFSSLVLFEELLILAFEYLQMLSLVVLADYLGHVLVAVFLQGLFAFLSIRESC
jgi:hypothetical protein